MKRTFLAACVLIVAPVSSGPSHAAQTEASISGEAYRLAALSLEALIGKWYAYPERLPGGRYKLTDTLQAEAELVDSSRELLLFAERALYLLADHHAITNASFSDSWAIIPSFSDLWIEKREARYFVTSVRQGSPAMIAGIGAGDELVAVNAIPVGQAVEAFWRDLGTVGSHERDEFAARVLGAGRRDRSRDLTLQSASGKSVRYELPNLYTATPDLPPINAYREGEAMRIVFNNSLGNPATIAAFDDAMAKAEPGRPIILDLTSTAGGGNTSVARAIMGWFVKTPSPYQMHSLPAEARQTGIERQWVELVLPREGKHHDGPVRVEVGRWTGSMGEGLAIGFDALGACVSGTRMAGLLGAIEDFQLGETKFGIKLPYERLMAVDGTPREEFLPKTSCN